MARRPAKQSGRDPKGERKRSFLPIGIIALVVVVALGLLTLAMLRPDTANQSGGSTANANTAAAQPATARQLRYEVIGSIPHDPSAYLQGLLWHNGGLYESTGLEGRSTLRRVEYPSGKVLKSVKLSAQHFGEGLALVDNRLIQLTWKSQRGFVYDLESFRLLGEFTYETEGWGLTFDGKHLIMSDGSHRLTFLDPKSFAPIRRLAVSFDNRPLQLINELEFIEGEIWANVYQSNMIVRIDPATGKVTSFLDMKDLLPPEMRTGNEDVLNGIAYDSDRKLIFVGGKLWPRLFEIRVK